MTSKETGVVETASRATHISSGDNNDDDDVLEAKVVAMFPPRPDAIMTILHSDEYLPGVQTLLYSLKKNLQNQQRMYPPEIVVCVTSNVTTSMKKLYSLLVPALCTRILSIDDWPVPLKSIDSKLSKKKPLKRTLDDHNPNSWSKLQIFGLQQYDTILYVDSDCLIVKDITSLLDLNKQYTESEALIAAAPDVLPPDKFNSGVMVIRPSIQTLQKMKQHSTLLTTYDQSDTGFLNAYFSNWFTDMPPYSRLPVGYNAQQIMFDITCGSGGGSDDDDDDDDSDDDNEDNDKDKDKDGDDDSYFSNFWDVQISGDLYIIHYSNPTKPWEEETATTSLVALWKDWYRKSKTFLARYHKEAQAKKEKELKQQQQQQASAATAASMSPPSASAATAAMGGAKTNTAKAINKRYKELRKQHGLSTKDAMDQARNELLPASQLNEEYTPSQQVAAMFGMM